MGRAYPRVELGRVGLDLVQVFPYLVGLVWSGQLKVTHVQL